MQRIYWLSPLLVSFAACEPGDIKHTSDCATTFLPYNGQTHVQRSTLEIRRWYTEQNKRFTCTPRSVENALTSNGLHTPSIDLNTVERDRSHPDFELITAELTQTEPQGWAYWIETELKSACCRRLNYLSTSVSWTHESDPTLLGWGTSRQTGDFHIVFSEPTTREALQGHIEILYTSGDTLRPTVEDINVPSVPGTVFALTHTESIHRGQNRIADVLVEPGVTFASGLTTTDTLTEQPPSDTPPGSGSEPDILRAKALGLPLCRIDPCADHGCDVEL